MTEEALKRVDYYSPLTLIVWLLSLPIRLFTFIVTRIRVYNPEKDICPACGFKGDSGTGGKSCLVTCTPVTSTERVALQHICFRCTAHYYTPVLTKAVKWMK
jgi:hypothetical protein